MKRITVLISLVALVASTALADPPRIVRRPGPLEFGRGKLTTLPPYDPTRAEQPDQMDLRSYDLTAFDLKGREKDHTAAMS